MSYPERRALSPRRLPAESVATNNTTMKSSPVDPISPRYGDAAFCASLKQRQGNVENRYLSICEGELKLASHIYNPGDLGNDIAGVAPALQPVK